MVNNAGSDEGAIDETTIEARLAEQETFDPPKSFVDQANANDPAVYDRFQRFPDAYSEMADLLTWDEPYQNVFDGSNPPFFKWFTGGRLNATVNCIDRHLGDSKDKTALLWEGEPGDVERISYQDLFREVNEFASVLRSLGVEEGDVVTIHLPMVPALPISMLACARIGAPHSVVFGGFSAKAVAERMDDANSTVLITIDGYYRNGEFLDHKRKADDAVKQADVNVEHVLVWTRHDELHERTGLIEGRDKLVSELMAEHRGERVAPVSRESNDPLFLMYTSGTTGQPKGVQHGTGGYLAYATWTSKMVEDIHPEDTYWCMADIGWITGHSYIVYGPLALGATSLMYEGAPGYPDKGRTWALAEKYDVDIFHTSPTAVRLFMKWGEDWPKKYDFSFKHMTTVGEPIQPEAWLWYYRNIGKEEAVIVDTWWQTETGGHLLTGLPALKKMKPGSAGVPVPGIAPAIVDDNGAPVEPGKGIAGNLLITRPWPGMLQTLYGNEDRYINTYWAEFSNTTSKDYRDWNYKSGDGAIEAEDGYFRVLGRLDDVMNVAGHRLGTMELESAVLTVTEVAEAAVAPRRDDLKGQVPVVFASLREGSEANDDLRSKIIQAVEDEISPIARPASIYFVDDLPKTRSGKIMRRLLGNIANGEELGNTTTLRDPSVPERIQKLLETSH